MAILQVKMSISAILLTIC